MKDFKVSDFKKEIIKEYGSIPKLKKHLKDNATYEYGTYISEVIVYGCKITYTSNPNCFASFIVKIPCAGFTREYGLDAKSITEAGKKRGCANYYI